MHARPIALAALAVSLAPLAAFAQTYPTATQPPAYQSAPAPAPATLNAAAAGVPLAGGLGVGVTSSDAPLGVRYWGEGFGFAAGVGFTFNGNEFDATGDDAEDEHTAVNWGLELSGMLPIHIGQSSILFGALTLNVDRDYAAGTDDDLEAIHSSTIVTQLGPQIGIEAFMGALGLPELSFLGTIGLPLTYGFGAEQDGDRDSDWSFGTASSGLSIVAANVGFHYYFSP